MSLECVGKKKVDLGKKEGKEKVDRGHISQLACQPQYERAFT